MTGEDKKFVLGVDLDGVCADFYEGIRFVAEEWLGVQELPREVTYGLPEWNLDRAGGYEPLHRFAVTQRGLFENIHPIDGAAPTLRRIAQMPVRIRIITHRLFVKHFHRQAVEQTVAWLEKHGFPYWDICFMRDKAAVGADLYVEDAPANVDQLRAAGHDVIVFTNSTNRALKGPRADNWDDVERLVVARVREQSARISNRPVAGT